MNNFRRSVEEIVQVVKIADTTLKKRLDEFKATPSGSLTLADFRSVWLDAEMDPPAFTKGREKEEAERKAAEVATNGVPPEDIKGKGKGKKKRKGKRKRGEESDKEKTPEVPPQVPAPADAHLPMNLNQGILAGTMDPLVNGTQGPPPGDHANIDPALLQQSSSAAPISPVDTPLLAMPPTDFVEESVTNVLAEEVSTFLQNSQGAQLSEALNEAEQRRLAQITVTDELLGLDEEELDCFILTEEEVRIKERVWVELNRDYLEGIAGESPFHLSLASCRNGIECSESESIMCVLLNGFVV
jgi:transcription factor IIIB subunit 2